MIDVKKHKEKAAGVPTAFSMKGVPFKYHKSKFITQRL